MTVAETELCLPGLVRDAVQETAEVVEQQQMARNTWRLRLRCPQVARRIVPGQFFMIRLPGRSDPLLGRPFALYDVYGDPSGEPEGIDFGYVVVGKVTSLLQTLSAGDRVEIWGPLGNGFPVADGGHLAIVAGGIGQTPFLALVRETLKRRQYGHPPRIVNSAPAKISMCYGVRSQEYLAGVDEFRREGIDFHVATDDGSAGRRGFVTDLLKELLASDSPPTSIYCCGPEPMMRAVAKIANESGVRCLLSLETPMACGIGACFSCVTKIAQDDGTWDYRRVCVEGPVFPADRVVFD